MVEAASLCRSLALSDIDGAGAFLLFALYFESLAVLREGTAVDADKYDSCISELLDPIRESLQAIENFDALRLSASLDSFARTAARLRLP